MATAWANAPAPCNRMPKCSTDVLVLMHSESMYGSTRICQGLLTPGGAIAWPASLGGRLLRRGIAIIGRPVEQEGRLGSAGGRWLWAISGPPAGCPSLMPTRSDRPRGLSNMGRIWKLPGSGFPGQASAT